MNKYIIVLAFIIAPLWIQTQESDSLEKYITGRWIEISRTEGDVSKDITEYQDTYIFRENKLFHKGEATEGIILFSITGKFSVEKNTIFVIYKDYTNRATSAEKAKEIIFYVASVDKKKNEMHVIVRDYDYEYQMILKKQHSE